MKEKRQKFEGYYLPLGISFGLLLGVVFHNIAAGLCLGVSFGCLLELTNKKKTKKHPSKNTLSDN